MCIARNEWHIYRKKRHIRNRFVLSLLHVLFHPPILYPFFFLFSSHHLNASMWIEWLIALGDIQWISLHSNPLGLVIILLDGLMCLGHTEWQACGETFSLFGCHSRSVSYFSSSSSYKFFLLFSFSLCCLGLVIVGRCG